ncbi:hypothetical protein WN48_05355 [Eufriesea mexicana]|nr:hypothetical protein WN48_05355 [Eufriesea mexicana]
MKNLQENNLPYMYHNWQFFGSSSNSQITQLSNMINGRAIKVSVNLGTPTIEEKPE